MAYKDKSKAELIAELENMSQQLEELKDYQERFRVLSEYMGDYAYAHTVNPDGSRTHEWTTGSFERVTGYSPGKKFQIYHPDDLEQATEDARTMMDGKATIGEYRVVRPDGEIVWLRLHRLPVWDEDEGRVIRYYGIAQDITKRKEAETIMQLSEDRFRSIVDDQTDFIARWTSDYKLTFVNSAFATHHGKEIEELIGTSFFNGMYASEREQILATIETLTPENPTFTSLNHSKTVDGRTIRQEWVNRAIFGLEGEILEYQSVGRDITHRLEAEKHRVELGIQKEKVRLLEELVSDLSHDIKTPISNIHTYIYLLRQNTTPEKQKQYLEILEVQVNRLNKLIDDILTVSQLDKGHKLLLQPVNLNQLLKDVITIYQPSAIHKNVQFTWTLGDDLPSILANPIALSRAIANLVENAINYTRQSGTVHLEVFADETDVVLSIKDTGIGIDAEDLNRIFDRFYRADKSRATNTGGTGLGLAIVKKIIDQHKGSITVESQPRQGSCFTIRLPKIEVSL